MNLPYLEERIPNLTGVLVLIIALCAFALSFFNLQEAATDAGINPYLSWLWPLCIDALLVAGSLMILRSSLLNESTRPGWSVLLSFTIVSIAFNTIHSPPDIISCAAHAIPPIALCISIELFMLTIESDLTKSRKAIDQEDAIVEPSQPEIEIPTNFDIPKYFKVINAYRQMENPTIPELTEETGISKNTVRKYIDYYENGERNHDNQN